MEADFAVEDARVLDVLGLQLDLLLVDGRTGQLGQSLSDFLAGRTTVAARMTEPARVMKDQPRSQVARKTLPQAGMWYAGSSITKGAGSPAKSLVFFRMIPEQMMAAMPMK